MREIKFRPKIAQHDYDTKKGHVERFLKARDKVKVTIMFRGREMAHPERGEMILNRLAEDLGELATVEQRPQQDGRNMTMMLAPARTAAEDGEPRRPTITKPRSGPSRSRSPPAPPCRRTSTRPDLAPARSRSPPSASKAAASHGERPFLAAYSASSPETPRCVRVPGRGGRQPPAAVAAAARGTGR